MKLFQENIFHDEKWDSIFKDIYWFFIYQLQQLYKKNLKIENIADINI